MMRETYDPDNIFAKILRGEAPCHRVFEDENTLVFMDIFPRADGHTLIVPKYGARNLFDVPSDVLPALFLTVQRVAIAATRAFGADGATIVQSNEHAGGQIVFHLHVHVIPRMNGVDMREGGIRADDTLLAQHADSLKAAFG